MFSLPTRYDQGRLEATRSTQRFHEHARLALTMVIEDAMRYRVNNKDKGETRPTFDFSS